MRNIHDIIKVGDIYRIMYSGMRSEFIEIPFFIKELGKDFIHVETFYEESEVDATEFESEEELEDYIDSNIYHIWESSIVIKEEFIIMRDKIGLFSPMLDEEVIDLLHKNKERYESSMMIKKMYKNTEA